MAGGIGANRRFSRCLPTHKADQTRIALWPNQTVTERHREPKNIARLLGAAIFILRLLSQRELAQVYSAQPGSSQIAGMSWACSYPCALIVILQESGDPACAW